MNIAGSAHRAQVSVHRDRLLRLFDRPKFAKIVGNHRMNRWVTKLRAWFPGTWPLVIGVVGSNGKGSTAAMIHSILSQTGALVGRYTSPHFVDFRERIRIGSVDVTDPQLGSALDWLDQQLELGSDIESADPTTAFECFTVVAMFVFLSSKVDAIVAEAGMGGRLDPTRSLDPTVVAFTSVDLEHTDVLGNTLEQIALEKAQIARFGSTLWLGAALSPAVVREVELFCGRTGVVVRQTPRCVPTATELGQCVDLTVSGRTLRQVFVPLHGRFQARNAALAANVAMDVMQRLWRVSELDATGAVYSGLAHTSWPGRLQRVWRSPPVVVDVGHSVDGINEAALGMVELAAGRPIHVVLGVSYNKPLIPIVEAAVSAAYAVYCTRARHRGAPEELILQAAQAAAPTKPAFSFPDVATALACAMAVANGDDGWVWVAGGFFLAAEASAILQGVELDVDLFY